MRFNAVIVAMLLLLLAAGCSTSGTPAPTDRASWIYDGLSPAPPADGAVGAWATGGRVRSIRAVSAEEVWVETKRHRVELGEEEIRMRTSGLYRAQEDGTMLLAYAPYRPLTIDTDGTAWMRAGFGVQFFEAGEWKRATPDDRRSRAIRDGTVWSLGESARCGLGDVTGPNELYRDDGTTVTHWECDAFPPLVFREVVAGPDGVAYLMARTVDSDISHEVAVGEPVVYRIDDIGVQPFEVPLELASVLDRSRSIEVAPNGDVWVAAYAEIEDGATALLGRFDGTAWRIFSAFRKFGTTWPVRNFEDRVSIGPDDRVWVAAGRNLAVFERGRWSKMPVDGGGVASVSVAPDGSIWVGIRTAIHRFPADWPAVSAEEPSQAGERSSWLIPLAGVISVAVAITVAWILRRRRSQAPTR